MRPKHGDKNRVRSLEEDLKYVRMMDMSLYIYKLAYTGDYYEVATVTGRICNIDVYLRIFADYPHRYPSAIVLAPFYLGAACSNLVNGNTIPEMSWRPYYSVWMKINDIEQRLSKMLKNAQPLGSISNVLTTELPLVKTLTPKCVSEPYPPPFSIAGFYRKMDLRVEKATSEPKIDLNRYRSIEYYLTPIREDNTSVPIKYDVILVSPNSLHTPVQKVAPAQQPDAYLCNQYINKAIQAYDLRGCAYNDLVKQAFNQLKANIDEKCSFFNNLPYRSSRPDLLIKKGSAVADVMDSLYNSFSQFYDYGMTFAAMQASDALLDKLAYTNFGPEEMWPYLNLDDLSLRINLLSY